MEDRTPVRRPRVEVKEHKHSRDMTLVPYQILSIATVSFFPTDINDWTPPSQGFGGAERVTNRVRLLGYEVTIAVTVPEEQPLATMRIVCGLDHSPSYVLTPGLNPVYQNRWESLPDATGFGGPTPISTHIPYEDPTEVELYVDEMHTISPPGVHIAERTTVRELGSYGVYFDEATAAPVTWGDEINIPPPQGAEFKQIGETYDTRREYGAGVGYLAANVRAPRCIRYYKYFCVTDCISEVDTHNGTEYYKTNRPFVTLFQDQPVGPIQTVIRLDRDWETQSVTQKYLK